MKYYSFPRNKLITDASDTDDVFGFGWIFLEFFSEAENEIIYGAGSGYCIVSPNFVQQIVAVNDLVFVANKVSHDLKLLVGKADFGILIKRLKILKIKKNLAVFEAG